MEGVGVWEVRWGWGVREERVMAGVGAVDLVAVL